MGTYKKIKYDNTNIQVQSAIEDGSGNTITSTYGTITSLNNKMDKTNPTGTGSFSLNRMEGYTVGSCSFAEGCQTVASGTCSHAEGSCTIASGGNSHAEGISTTASGDNSHAEGEGTTAQGRSQHVFGEYNILDNTGTSSTRGTYVEIVGKGTSNGSTIIRSNARTLDWSGNEVLAGKLTVGAAPTNNMDVATKQYADTKSVVSGTNDGTNWQTLTIDGTTKNIPVGGGSTYTAGDGIDITDNEISVDTEEIATVEYVDDSVTGFVTQDEVEEIVEEKIAENLELFWCTYGTTTYTEIKNALQNGKLPVCKSGNYIFVFSKNLGDTSYSYFNALQGTSGEYLQLYNVTSSWARQPYQLQNKLTSGSSIKTINNESILSSGNLSLATSTDLQQGLATKMTIGAVSGTNDGTNWQTITINGTTKNIPNTQQVTPIVPQSVFYQDGTLIVDCTQEGAYNIEPSWAEELFEHYQNAIYMRFDFSGQKMIVFADGYDDEADGFIYGYNNASLGECCIQYTKAFITAQGASIYVGNGFVMIGANYREA